MQEKLGCWFLNKELWVLRDVNVLEKIQSETIFFLNQQILWTFRKKRVWCQFFPFFIKKSLKDMLLLLGPWLKGTKLSCGCSLHFGKMNKFSQAYFPTQFSESDHPGLTMNSKPSLLGLTTGRRTQGGREGSMNCSFFPTQYPFRTSCSRIEGTTNAGN